jgi:iron complex outermembrane recepter protein
MKTTHTKIAQALFAAGLVGSLSATLLSTTVSAQEPATTTPTAPVSPSSPPSTQPKETTDKTSPTAATDKSQKTEKVSEQIVVTGSRFAKQDFDSNSPILTISAEELAKHSDITLDTFLNTLPQVNPSGTTTSNNPPNSGQSNIDLRGLGANRNLVLIDGRRAMVSASNQTVDLNTIPMAMVESIEIISGGAGAVYGADAIAGVVNVKLKRRFEGVDVRAGWTDSEKFKDARERNLSIVMGGNFADQRGNAVIGYEYSERKGLIKSQRDFAAAATGTTSFFPEGTYRPGSNAPSQAAVNALYGQASYGSATAGTVPNTSAHSFNSDGSLFYPGIFNSPRDVLNYRYPRGAGENPRFFPDFYSYNFDAVNILVLPLERKSVLGKFNYKLTNDIEVFSSFSNTLYTSTTALAPTPVPTIVVASTSSATSTQGSSSLITPGSNVGGQLIVPTTNPFIPADLRTLLNSRTGDNPAIIGSGATEPFLMRWRTLSLGLRTEEYENNVTQYAGGLKGAFLGDLWKWEVNASEGRTKVSTTQSNNVDTNKLLNALAAPDGGRSLCEGGINPFGRQTLSASCQAYLRVSGGLKSEFTQSIGQAFVSGEVMQLAAGPLSVVIGGEFRNFKYDLNPGASSGPISGFNVQSAAGGSNKFRDLFGEVSVPVLRDAPFAKSLDVHMAFRSSQSESTDQTTGDSSPKKRSNAWAIDFSWEPTDTIRARGALQQSVRAPNFGELFDGGGNSPQIFDPCSVTSQARTTGSNASRLATLCQNAGQSGGLGTAVSTFVQTPGGQVQIVTAGDRNLKPETGNSATIGLVWAPKLEGLFKGIRASVDYYSVKVKDAINTPDTNEFIADCYNFYGNNASYNPAYSNCAALTRGGDIIGLSNLSTPDGAFPNTNGGTIKTSGIDAQVNWSNKLGPGRLDVGLQISYLLAFKVQTLKSLPTNDFSGTIPYFGAGLGQAFPKLKASLNTRYQWGDFAFDVRARYIDKMKNRMEIIFPGEQFSGVAATTYWDLGANYTYAKNYTLRLGLLNAFDQKPRTYAPNVQSGTDPSTYDVIGRRLLAQAQFKF